jgi:hypothetical protein
MSTYISTAEFTKKHGHFRISEYCIEQKPPTKRIADIILSNHITPMNAVREAVGEPVLVSKRSGYRPRKYEQSKGRTGNSQHNFEESHPNGTGAADYTSASAKDLIEPMLEHTCYTRVCYYPNNNFVHADFKPTPSGKRELYTAQSPTSKWKLDRVVDIQK